MTRILCYDIHYADYIEGPEEVEVLVNLPANWKFDYVPARNAVKEVLEKQTELKVNRFEWRPL